MELFCDCIVKFTGNLRGGLVFKKKETRRHGCFLLLLFQKCSDYLIYRTPVNNYNWLLSF